MHPQPQGEVASLTRKTIETQVPIESQIPQKLRTDTGSSWGFFTNTGTVDASGLWTTLEMKPSPGTDSHTNRGCASPGQRHTP